MSTTTTPASTTAGTTAGTTARTTARTRLGLLAGGLVGWAVASLAQAATRDGFDILRHPLSQLATGDLGAGDWADLLGGLGEAGAVELLTLVGYYRLLALQMRVLRIG